MNPLPLSIRCVGLMALCILAFAPVSAFASQPAVRLTRAACAIQTLSHTPGIDAAVEDLRRDLGKVLGGVPELTKDAKAPLSVRIDSALAAETYQIAVGDAVEIRGGDELGTIYGVYEFTHRFLGVDPLWFWKDLEPARKEVVEVPAGCYANTKPVFRYRGWFINDEDLLGRWKESGKSRFLDWPGRAATLANPDHEFYEKRLLKYYTPIIDAGVMEYVYEAMLRMGCNLSIPSSFVDIMNEPEADLIRGAVRRGLYVSQHHVEPLGVSFAAYETWWSKQGRVPAFSYRTASDEMRACWKAYAQRWYQIAGDRVIWQVGLRGRGDRPLWDGDPASKERAGEFISSAIADQMEIVRGIDARPQPPATLTLWLEGAELIRQGKLVPAQGITCIFADSHTGQEMQQDFADFNRTPDRQRGFYYHVAVWGMGPHLVQGPTPEKISRVVTSVADKGDTNYAILNVSNVREHLLGLTVWSRQVWQPAPITNEQFLAEWCPPGSAPLYQEFLDTAVPVKGPWLLHDGSARNFYASAINSIKGAKKRNPELTPALQEKLKAVIPRLEALQTRAGKVEVPVEYRPFFESNFKVQLAIRLGLYRALSALLEPSPDLDLARNSLQSILDAFPRAEQGKWEHWYRGDAKLGIAGLLESLKTTTICPLTPTKKKSE